MPELRTGMPVRIVSLAEGVNAQLVIVKGPTHYETRRFAEPLKGAVGWLRDVWDTAPQPCR